MTTEPGTRVWVVRDADDTTVYAYGFGTYLGDRLMPGWDHPKMLAMCADTIRRSDAKPPIIDPHVYYGRQVTDGKLPREQADAEIARVEAADEARKARPVEDRARDLARSCGMNPLIELDAGGQVWGAECWWGEADDDTPTTWAKGRTIVTVPAPARVAVAP